MGTRLIRLRYDGRCQICGAEVAAGERAWWDGDAKTVYCASCGSLESTSTESGPSKLDLGIPGRSALVQGQRRRQRREDAVLRQHPHTGRIRLALSGESQSISAWEQGARGERHVGGLLDGLRPRGILTLHDRKIPGSSANIDHIVVAPSGVWVVDAKNYTGRVERRGRFSGDVRLYVNGKNRTRLAAAMNRQVEVVRRAVGAHNVPVHAVLCFAGGEWGLFAKPFVVGDAWVMWPKRLLATIEGARSHGVPVPEIASELATCLRAV
jgi:hypothetical protein